MEQLQDRYMETQSNTLKLQISSLSPYTTPETVEIFGTSEYMPKKSHKLKDEYGILPEVPIMSKGKVVTKGVIHKVRDFYESDENSRQCPQL